MSRSLSISPNHIPQCAKCERDISGPVINRGVESWCRPCYTGKPVTRAAQPPLPMRGSQPLPEALIMRTVSVPPPREQVDTAPPLPKPKPLTARGASLAMSRRIIARVNGGMSWRNAVLEEHPDASDIFRITTRAQSMFYSIVPPEARPKVDKDHAESRAIIANHDRGMTWIEAARLAGAQDPERAAWRAQTLRKKEKRQAARAAQSQS